MMPVGTDESRTIPYRRVMVTGGTGFVGRHLVPRLSAALGQGAVLWLAGRSADWSAADSDFERIQFDLADAATIRAAIAAARPDLIVHLAGEASVGAAAASAIATWRLNTVAMLEMASAIVEHAPDATILYVSSAEVYGRAFLAGAASEDDAPMPASVYAQSKLAAEHVLLSALPKESNLIVVRPSNHIGPGQDQRFVMPAFAAQIAAMEADGAGSIRVGNLESERDFMDVRDTVSAYLALLSLPASADRRRVFNVASGETHSVGGLLEIMRGLARVETDVQIDERRFRPAEIPRAAVDASRLRSATGWAPTIPIERTIADVLDDWRARRRG